MQLLPREQKAYGELDWRKSETWSFRQNKVRESQPPSPKRHTHVLKQDWHAHRSPVFARNAYIYGRIVRPSTQVAVGMTGPEVLWVHG